MIGLFLLEEYPIITMLERYRLFEYLNDYGWLPYNDATGVVSMGELQASSSVVL